jgi:hypothetical protein
MKSCAAFAELPLSDQFNTLWEEGHYLLNRRVGSYTVSLYALKSFYVEVWLKDPEGITQIIVLESFIQLDAYLNKILLRGLFC